MPKRVAITIAGAVSLGSYEAGVLYELLRAFASWNQQLGLLEDNKIYVDVLTGASAGAMTAAMVAQRLMYDADALGDDSAHSEPTNSLYDAWVKRISLLGLVKMRWKEPKWHSLLSSDLIELIGNDLLIQSMNGPHGKRHLAIEPGQPLRVGFALTNIGGIDYTIPIPGNDDEGFNYTTSADQKLFLITGERTADGPVWNPMCAAAVASGAFPVAFRPQSIAHSSSEYNTPKRPVPPNIPEPGVCYLDFGDTDPALFCHCDGGVLQNQPLGIAKNLVEQAAACRTGSDALAVTNDRLYVFVSPHSVRSRARAVDANKLTIWSELRHLMNVYLRQAIFHDWITAEEVNGRIAILDERALQLAEVMKHGFLSVPELAKATSDLNALLMPNDGEDRLDRLRTQFADQYKDLNNTCGQAAADAYISALATLEAAAHLQDRDKMKIVAVIASESELAGAGLAAFIGFFRKSYRQHDYWVGRCKTRKYLKRNDVKRILGVTEWPAQVDLSDNLPNPSGIVVPVGIFSLVRAAIVPAFLFLAVRWVTWLVLIVLLVTVWGIRNLH